MKVIVNNLVAFADRELRNLGFDPEAEEGPAKWFYENVMELVETFVGQGHSGMSAPMVVALFEKVALYKPLGPLTGEDSEWTDIGSGTFQNKRCNHVFKENGVAYDIQGKVFRDASGTCYTNRDSRVDITFPYTPKTEYVEAPSP